VRVVHRAQLVEGVGRVGRVAVCASDGAPVQAVVLVLAARMEIFLLVLELDLHQPVPRVVRVAQCRRIGPVVRELLPEDVAREVVGQGELVAARVGRERARVQLVDAIRSGDRVEEVARLNFVDVEAARAVEIRRDLEPVAQRIQRPLLAVPELGDRGGRETSVPRAADRLGEAAGRRRRSPPRTRRRSAPGSDDGHSVDREFADSHGSPSRRPTCGPSRDMLPSGRCDPKRTVGSSGAGLAGRVRESREWRVDRSGADCPRSEVVRAVWPS
jgi:hypothetical protein